MAWIREYEKVKALTVPFVNAVEKVVTKIILKTSGKKNMRSFTKHEALGVEQITFAVASQTFGSAKITEDMVLSVLSNSPSIGKRVYDIYLDIKTSDMTKQNRMVAMASAIALDKVQE